MKQSFRRRGPKAVQAPTSSGRRSRHFRDERIGLLFVVSLLLVRTVSAQTDAVIEWNAIMQMTVAPSSPFIQARSAAITQLAVFEAVNAIDKDYAPYLGTITAPRGASPEAAAVAAAHRVLATLYPASASTLDAARAASLSAIPDGPAKDDGISVGETAAAALLALRAGDGADAVVPYVPGTEPGDWQPTPLAFAPAFLPGWGQVKTFALENGAQFRPGPPPALHTGKYARDYEEVKDVGDVNSTTRPQDRTDVARFYAVTPPVQLSNSGARQVSQAQGKTLSENARDFALLSMAISDALVSSMEAKYHYNFWRPVTAIRAADTDGNRHTHPDPEWLPLITTPPYPSYPSNHASGSGAARAVLERLYGEDGLDVTLSTPQVPDVVLEYTAWKQITDDIDDARVFGGIHFRFEQEVGARLGRHVGTYVMNNFLRQVKGRSGVHAAAEVATPAASEAVPTGFAVHQNSPNPFNPSTDIRFDLPEATTVRVVVYDVMGREVARLVDGALGAGSHLVRWNAEGLPSGMYLYRITAGDFAASRNMLLLK